MAYVQSIMQLLPNGIGKFKPAVNPTANNLSHFDDIMSLCRAKQLETGTEISQEFSYKFAAVDAAEFNSGFCVYGSN